MSEAIGVVGARRHFSSEEEEVLRRNESTNAIVRRNPKVTVDIHGVDRSLREVKARQQEHVSLTGAGGVGHAIVEGHHFVAGGGAGFGVAIGAAAGLGVGTHEWLEAQVKGREQSAAIRREQAHVAVVAVLDLPATYKAQRLDKDLASVPKGTQSIAFKLTEGLMADPKGIAQLQLNCDRGMNAARDLTRSGMSVEAFLKANPKIAEAYMKDAAFHEGFDAYLHARANLPTGAAKELDRRLDERDGWYAQSQISIRV